MNCGYPVWAFKQVKDKIDNKLSKEEKNKRKKEQRDDQVQTKFIAKNLQKTWGCNTTEAAQDLEAALGPPQEQTLSPGLGMSSILHPM